MGMLAYVGDYKALTDTPVVKAQGNVIRLLKCYSYIYVESLLKILDFGYFVLI